MTLARHSGILGCSSPILTMKGCIGVYSIGSINIGQMLLVLATVNTALSVVLYRFVKILIYLLIALSLSRCRQLVLRLVNAQYHATRTAIVAVHPSLRVQLQQLRITIGTESKCLGLQECFLIVSASSIVSTTDYRIGIANHLVIIEPRIIVVQRS